MRDWIEQLLSNPYLAGMGHDQRTEDANLGLGWLYYALARIVRPRRIVVIGSFRGFSPILFGRTLLDNCVAGEQEAGRVLFIDLSLMDDFWDDPVSVQAHFESYGITNVDHRKLTTQQYIETDEYRQLGEVGLVFIDGFHTAEQAAFDYAAFEREAFVRRRPGALLHDSARETTSKIYGPDKTYQRTVVKFVSELKERTDLQVFDLYQGAGLTLVRQRTPSNGSGRLDIQNE